MPRRPAIRRRCRCKMARTLLATDAGAHFERCICGRARSGDRLQGRGEAEERSAFSLIIGSVVIASSIVTAYRTGPHFEGIPLLGLVGYGVAAVLGLLVGHSDPPLGALLKFNSNGADHE